MRKSVRGRKIEKSAREGEEEIEGRDSDGGVRFKS